MGRSKNRLFVSVGREGADILDDISPNDNFFLGKNEPHRLALNLWGGLCVVVCRDIARDAAEEHEAQLRAVPSLVTCPDLYQPQ